VAKNFAMALNISFKLRSPQKNVSPSKQKETPVLMMINFGYCEVDIHGKKKYVPLKYATGEKIKPDHWNGKRAKQTSKVKFQNINTRLDKLEGYAKDAVSELLNKEQTPTPDAVKEIIDKKNPDVDTNDSKAKTLNAYIELFVDEIETGVRLSSKKERYSKSTVKNFKGFKAQLKEFQECKHKRYDFHQINLEFYDDFVEFFVKKKYSPNTIGRHIKNLKIIMHYAREEGLHENTEIDKKSFKVLRTEVENVYLTEKELKALYDVDLSETPHWDLARDVFLIGCYTAQRFSDYSQIAKENIKKLGGGKMILELVQQKTKEKVIVPLKPEAIAILEKYKFTLPKTYEQKVNSYIKKVAEKAEIKELIQIESVKGGVRSKLFHPKHDLVKTHTARRTGCTNMYLAGIPALDIMKLSGHKTEQEFLKYIKVTKEQTAKSLINHPFFN
jgi:integrase